MRDGLRIIFFIFFFYLTKRKGFSIAIKVLSYMDCLPQQKVARGLKFGIKEEE